MKFFMWNTFEKTGNIDAYLSFKEIENLRSGMDNAVNGAEEVESENTILGT
ncbi:MAG: YqzL family protein [Clostridia bacterium]